MSRERLAAAAGPLLIVAAVLVSLSDVAFAGMLSAQHVDPLPFWLPVHCFLGDQLAAGHLPVWNPYAMGGHPFAADPQSGWLYLPAMLLNVALPCGRALAAFTVLQPLLAGLGIYWFLREEGASRPAATVGGLALAMGISASRVAVTLPFSGALAWTALMLACCTRYLKAERASSRWLWLGLTALCGGQVASAHLSHGLAVGTLAVATSAWVRLRRDVREGRRTGRQALAAAGLLVGAFAAVNLAILLPRIAYLARSSLSLGYGGMEALTARLAGRAAPELQVGASVSPPWALSFATAPGAYLGAATLALSFAALRGRAHQALARGFGVFLLASYLLPLHLVGSLVASKLMALPLSDAYVHEPSRFRYGVLLALPVLGALGIDAWRAASHRRQRLLLAAPGVTVFWLVPPLLGVSWARLALPLAALALAGALLVGLARRPAFVVALPALLAVELVANAMWGRSLSSENVPTGVDPPLVQGPFTPRLEARVDPADYLREGPIVRRLRASGETRFLGIDLRRLGERGYIDAQEPQGWELLVNQRGMLFGLQDAQGYNPAQPLAPWTFQRAADPKDVRYNNAVYARPSGGALDLLGVGYVVGPSDAAPLPGLTPVVRNGAWTLYRRRPAPPRASVHTRWEVVTHDAALRAVAARGFGPSVRLLLEEDPGVRPGGGATLPDDGTFGVARYRSTAPNAATIAVRAANDSVVLIRNPHDEGWRAELDGEKVPLLRADYLMQAVAVPAGDHRIDLRYEDPWIGRGLAGSGVTMVTLGIAWALARRRERAGRAPT